MAAPTPGPTGPAPGSTGSPQDVLARARAVVELGVRACDAYRREDLADQLAGVRRTLSEPLLHVVVVGEFKKGKSSLVNALTGTRVCPVDDDVATAVPTHLRYGEQMAAALIYDGDPPQRRTIPVDQVAAWVVEGGLSAAQVAAGGDPAEPAPVGVEVRLPRKLLAGGLVLVDTPGVGGLGSIHSAASLAAASMAEALLFVTDASQELTRSEVDFLLRAQQMCPRVAVALTKIDFYPAWRKVKELNEQHLRAAGLDVPVFPVSSLLRAQAVSTNDTALNEESGFVPLVQHLVGKVGNEGRLRIAREAAETVVNVCTQLEAQFAAERAALADPAKAQEVVDQLNQVKQRVEALRSAAARWSTTLNDGIADLTSDVDYDLRLRIRNVLAEADRVIEETDPADTWSQMETWLQSRMATEMLANYELLRRRAVELSEQVAAHFQEASGQVLTNFPVSNPAPIATSIDIEHNIDLAPMKVGKQAMVALKSAYGGTMMFVMLGMLAGVALGPLALGIGIIMGRKGLREEKKRQMAARQSQARAAVRRYCDEVSFVMNKDSRDTLRRIQRELRDYYTALAEQLNRSNAEALRAATEATQRTEAQRRQRLADIDAELARIAQLRKRAEQVIA